MHLLLPGIERIFVLRLVSVADEDAVRYDVGALLPSALLLGQVADLRYVLPLLVRDL